MAQPRVSKNWATNKTNLGDCNWLELVSSYLPHLGDWGCPASSWWSVQGPPMGITSVLGFCCVLPLLFYACLMISGYCCTTFLNLNHMQCLIVHIIKFETRHVNIFEWAISFQINLKIHPYNGWPIYGEKEEIGLPSPWMRLKISLLSCLPV